MKCDKAQEFFSEYIENTLDRPMTVALESHLGGCEACSADVADLRSMWAVLDKVPQVEPPADFVWRTTTRLQNELLNRREAERAKLLPWWKRLTPAQSFSYAGIAALLMLGILFPVAMKNSTWGPNWPFGHSTSAPTSEAVAPLMTAPQFNVQLTGQGGATVTITATSEMPWARVTMAYLMPEGQSLRGNRQVVVTPRTLAALQSVPVPVQPGGAKAATIGIVSGSLTFSKTLILPDNAQPVLSLQNASPYFALQQVATLTGQAMLVDGGLNNPVTLDLQNVPPQQALQQVLAQTGARPAGVTNGVLAITK